MGTISQSHWFGCWGLSSLEFWHYACSWILHGDTINIYSLTLLHVKDFNSLEQLLKDCKLKSLPKQGLPSSLSRLYIPGCPLLKKLCQRYKRKNSPNISHIPCIVILDEIDSSIEEVIWTWGPCIQAFAFLCNYWFSKYFLLLFTFCAIHAHRVYESFSFTNQFHLTIDLPWLLQNWNQYFKL